METTTKNLQAKLRNCRCSIKSGYNRSKRSGIDWLDNFCAQFLRFTNELQDFFTIDLNKSVAEEKEHHVELIYLCLSQIVICIKFMERTIRTEDTGGVALSTTRQHFIDRIYWCLERLSSSLDQITTVNDSAEDAVQEYTFVELMDIVLDHLSPYSSYADDSFADTATSSDCAQASFDSKQIRSSVNVILGHILAFANVALESDKKALSALCQKALRECIGFQEECTLGHQHSNFCNRKLKAVALENALYQLEDCINDALLRLIYTCLLDYEKLSIERLRAMMHLCTRDDNALDDLIADFDVNIDRTTQIGIFAIGFAPNKKMKIKVRSCLASLECLDTCLIPSMQAGDMANLHSEILEDHFNEEVLQFKNIILEIIDSYALTVCYHDMLSKCITQIEKQFNKTELKEIIRMGEFLHEHFSLQVNQKELQRNGEGLHSFQRFQLILRECQAILTCVNQVDSKRVVKRFKILRSVVQKLAASLIGSSARVAKEKSNVFLISKDFCDDSQFLFESIDVPPSTRSILYSNETDMRPRRSTTDSLKVNYSKSTSTVTGSQSLLTFNKRVRNNAVSTAQLSTRSGNVVASCPVSNNNNNCNDSGNLKQRRPSVRRKESLRTSMFKRQKLTESEKAYTIYKDSSVSLQISEILDQLTLLSPKVTDTTQPQIVCAST